MNIIQTYYIRHCHVTYSVVLLHCHSKKRSPGLISPEEVGLLGTYCFVNTVNLDIQLFSHSDFAYYTVDKYANSDALTIILSEILNHLLNRLVQKHWWNKVFMCESINYSLHQFVQKHKFVQNWNYGWYLWVSHWIFHSNNRQNSPKQISP